ncbi:MAG: flagellin, partial [Verrucomicrobiota bacterium]
MVVNTNKNAVDAASSLQMSNSALSRSLSRLSSGSKIVNPSDDAAGLAISEKLSAQNSRIQAAQTNIQNAVSRIQTADGYLESMTGILDRMSELSVLAQDVTKVQSDIDNYNS